MKSVSFWLTLAFLFCAAVLFPIVGQLGIAFAFTLLVICPPENGHFADAFSQAILFFLTFFFGAALLIGKLIFS